MLATAVLLSVKSESSQRIRLRIRQHQFLVRTTGAVSQEYQARSFGGGPLWHVPHLSSQESAGRRSRKSVLANYPAED